MSLRWPEHPAGAHVRTCQECEHTQVMKDPMTQKGDNWRDAKCRKCHSEALDFGSKNMEIIDELDEKDPDEEALCKCGHKKEDHEMENYTCTKCACKDFQYAETNLR